MRVILIIYRSLLLVGVACLIGLVLLLSANYKISSSFIPSILGRHEPIWLIATMSAAHSQRRRNVIRATWQTMYYHPAITTRFVISDPGELWMPLIQHENKTYGDIIALSHLEENAQIANTIKSVELLRYLATCGHTWRFVSKLDDDSFLEVPRFYRQFIHPHLKAHDRNKTFIGRRMYHTHPEFEYAGGQFYTMSWDLVLVLAQLYSHHPVIDEHEDVLNGALLHEAGELFDFVELDNSQAFDFDETNADMWAWSHRIGSGAINPHKMKNDSTYLKVAAIFGNRGARSGW